MKCYFPSGRTAVRQDFLRANCMSFSLLTKLFGSRNDRLLKQYRKTAAQINALESRLESLSDEQLRGKTEEFKGRLDKGETLDQILPEAFAVVREASKRVLKLRHFDVQLIHSQVHAVQLFFVLFNNFIIRR